MRGGDRAVREQCLSLPRPRDPYAPGARRGGGTDRVCSSFKNTHMPQARKRVLHAGDGGLRAVHV